MILSLRKKNSKLKIWLHDKLCWLKDFNGKKNPVVDIIADGIFCIDGKTPTIYINGRVNINITGDLYNKPNKKHLREIKLKRVLKNEK